MPWGGPVPCRIVASLCGEQLVHLTGARGPWWQSAGEQGGPLGIEAHHRAGHLSWRLMVCL